MTNISPVNPEQCPTKQFWTDEQFADLAKDADCTGRLQLFTKGKAINKGMVQAGHYGIPESDEEVFDLGDSINIIPLARRPKAIDMTDTDAVLVNYDPESEEFKRIAATSLEKESHCMYGPSFLVVERSTGRFLEFFCGSKSTRSEAKNIYPFLPLTAADIARQKAAGNDVTGLEPHDALPLTLKSRLVEKGTYSWHLPVVVQCAEPFTKLPTTERILKEIMAFITVMDNPVERSPEKKQFSIRGSRTTTLERQERICQFLADGGKAAIRTIVDELGIPTATARHDLRQPIEAGWIERIAAPLNEYRVRVSLRP